MTSNSVQAMIDEASDFVLSYDFEAAKAVLQNALNLQPQNPQALDLLAEILLEMGEVDEAQTLLERSIQVNPNEGYSKYMNLGQIIAGHDAVQAFQKGIELMQKELATKSKQKSNKGLTYDTWIRIHPFGSSEEPEAESSCAECLEAAVQVDPNNWEVYQSMASFRISQQNNEDALVQISKSYEIWKSMDEEDFDRPSIDSRIACAKIMIELDSFQMAGDVLESILDELDDNAEIWYLLAFCYSHFDVRSAPECLENAKGLLQLQNVTDPSILKQLDDLEAKVKAEIARLPPSETDADEGGDTMEE